MSGLDERPLHLYEPDEVSSEEGLVYDSDGNLLGGRIIAPRQRRRRGRRRKIHDLITGVICLSTFFVVNFMLKITGSWDPITYNIAVVTAFCYGMYGLWRLYRFIFGIPQRRRWIFGRRRRSWRQPF